MKIKFIYLAILSAVISIETQAQYIDYIGAGHNSGITVTASGSDDGFSASDLINGSGLDMTSWVHNKNPENNMWISGLPTASPLVSRSDVGTWLQFDFGQAYQLSNLWVWNYAEEDVADIGVRDVIIDYSTDGINWTELGVFEWGKVDKSQPNSGFQGAVFNGINTRYVMISISDNWGGNVYGLSEVKFNIGSGTNTAANPFPLNGAIKVFKEYDLKWTKANGASSQQVYLGTSNPPALVGTTATNTYEPGILNAGTTYYWKIDDGAVWSFKTSSFAAFGITDSTQVPTPSIPHYPLRTSPVEVTFENTPTKMLFEQPTLLSLMTENGIGYNTGYLETTDPRVATSWETIGDVNCDYTKVWIESATDARIIVKQTAPLYYGGMVAHDNKANGTNYGIPGNEGFGDWAEEYYVIYPDGTHIRHATVHSGNIEGQYAEPYHYNMYTELDVTDLFFEFNEGLVCGKGSQTLRNAVDSNSVTLIKLDETHSTYSFAPVLSDRYPDNWLAAPIQLIHTNSEFKPFQIALPDSGLYVKPYWPDGCADLDNGCDPNVWSDGFGGWTTPIGHALNYTHSDSTYTSVSNIYLNGHIKSENAISNLSKLAKSWINAPALSINNSSFSGGEYQQHERAYVFERVSSETNYLDATISASSNNPLVNPAFVLKDWGTSILPTITFNGITLQEGLDYYQGKEGNNLVIYLKKESTSSVQLIIGSTTLHTHSASNIENNIILYPNPPKNILYATFDNLEEMIEITISGLDGKIISKRNIYTTTNNLNEIPVSNLQSGMYLVSLKWKDNLITKKIIIE